MKKILFIVLFFSFFYYGCVDAITSPTATGSSTTGDTQNPTITPKYPLTNDTVQLGSNEFLFEAKDDVGIRAVELWVDSTFKALVNYDGTTAAPSILWTIDSTYLRKTLKYFLRVFDTSGKATDSPVQTNLFVAKVIVPPKAPTGLALQKLSATIVNLSWKHDYLNVDGFRIYRKTEAIGIYSIIKEVSPKSFNTNDESVDPLSVYFYKVVAFNERGESPSSNEISNSGGASGGTIVAPTNVSAVAFGSRKIVLNWQDNSDNENYFKIERKTLYSNYEQIGILPFNKTTFKDSGYGLVPSTDYIYRIKAVSNDDSVTSTEVSAKTLGYDLLVPQNLRTINLNSKTIRLVWIDNNTNETQTLIERRSASSLTYSIIGSAQADETQYDDTDVILGLTYYYRIRVTDNVNFSGYTNEVSANVQSALINSPSNLQTYYGANNTINLTWRDNSNNEVNFSVERASDAALLNFTEIAVTDKDIAEFVDASTVGGITYAYRIRATDGIVYSGYSNVITIKNPSK
jgi:fibronectin type 3 domain-containing protein